MSLQVNPKFRLYPKNSIPLDTMAIENLFQKDYTDQGERENIPVKVGINANSMQIAFYL